VYSLRGDNFVTKVLKWARGQETLRIVEDQVASPTWARMLAEVTALLLSRGVDYLRERAGLYHLAGGGFASLLRQASRCELAQAILRYNPNRKSIQARKYNLPWRVNSPGRHIARSFRPWSVGASTS